MTFTLISTCTDYREIHKPLENRYLGVHFAFSHSVHVDKVKCHFLPKPNLTRKIEFVSKEVEIVEPEIFGLLLLRNG